MKNKNISTIQHLKMPNSFEQLLNGIFGGMYCFQTFKVDEISLDKAEDDGVFNSKDNFEDAH